MFKGHVVSYIIDSSCKSESKHTQTVMDHADTTDYFPTKHRLIDPVQIPNDEHVLDFTTEGTPVDYSEEYAQWLKRQQHEGKGKHHIKTKRMGIHKKFTRKSKHHKKKSNTKRKRL